jgi:hypothetical protein
VGFGEQLREPGVINMAVKADRGLHAASLDQRLELGPQWPLADQIDL